MVIGHDTVDSSGSLIVFTLEDTLCSSGYSYLYYYDIRTGKWEEIDYYIGTSGSFVCANNKYAFYANSNEVYTVDVNGDSSIDIRDLVRLKKILTSYISDDWVDKDLGEQGNHDIF